MPCAEVSRPSLTLHWWASDKEALRCSEPTSEWLLNADLPGQIDWTLGSMSLLPDCNRKWNEGFNA